MNERQKDIPALQRDGRNLNAVMDALQEVLQTYRGYRGDPLDRALTIRDLDDVNRKLVLDGSRTAVSGGGVGATGPAGPIGPPGTITPDPTPPPTAIGLAVSSGISHLFVQCDTQTYTAGHGHGVTVVYGAKWPSGTPPTFSGAVELFRFEGTFSAYPSDPSTRWCIWIKWRSIDGYLSNDPAGGTNGQQTTTATDPSLLVAALAGQIRESSLYGTLGDRIDLIDGVGAGSVNLRIATSETAIASLVTTLQARIASAGANRLRNSGFEAESSTSGRATGWSPYNNTGLEPSTATLVTGRLGGLAGRLTWVGVNTSTKGFYASQGVDGSALGGVIGGWKPGVTYTLSWYARSNATIAGGMGLGWNVSPAVATGLQNPTVETYWQRWVMRITWGATTEAIGSLFITIVGAAPSGYIEIDDVQVQEGDLLTGYSSGDEAELVAAVQTETTARANADGSLFAQYTVKLDVNGYVSGFGLASTSAVAAPFSSFIVRADSFSVASPSGPSIAPIVPFIVRTTPGSVNGVAYPAGVYMDSAYILDLTAAVVRLGAAWIDDAKIANLSASKLTVGSGIVGGNLRSTVYTSGVAGWILQPNGNVEFANAAVRGQVTGGAISGFSWPSAGAGGGFYLGPSGLLLGNANDGKYLQVNANGDLYAPGFSIVGGAAQFAGKLTVGAAPLVSGTTMTGAGAVINPNGTFALGSTTGNVSFNGSTLTLNGNVVAAGNFQSGAVKTADMFANSATDLVITSLLNDTWVVPTSASATLRTLGTSTYTNTTGGPISVEVSFTCFRTLTNPAGAFTCSAFHYMQVKINGVFSQNFPYATNNPEDINNLGPNQSRGFSQSYLEALDMAAGDVLSVSSIMSVASTFTGTTLSTDGLKLRLGARKR